MSGGMAPTTAPTQVLDMLMTLSGVYTPAYRPMLAAPSAAVVAFVCKDSKLRFAQHSCGAFEIDVKKHMWLQPHILTLHFSRSCSPACMLARTAADKADLPV